MLAVAALAAVVMYCSRRARAWTDELAHAPASQLRDHPDTVAFDVASVRALRVQKSNELWIDTTTGSHTFGVHGSRPFVDLRAAYPALWR